MGLTESFCTPASSIDWDTKWMIKGGVQPAWLAPFALMREQETVALFRKRTPQTFQKQPQFQSYLIKKTKKGIGCGMLYSGIITAVLIAVLLYSTVTDIRRHELPIEMFLLAILPLGVIGQILCEGPDLFEVIGITTVVAGCYLILALFFDGGGGDVIMMTSMAVCLGNRMIIIVAIATVLLFIYRITIKREAQIPYAPFVTVGFAIERILYFIK